MLSGKAIVLFALTVEINAGMLRIGIDPFFAALAIAYGSDRILAQERLFVKYTLSARLHHRMLKLTRTIADWAGEKEIALRHLAEALQYRPWGCCSGWLRGAGL